MVGYDMDGVLAEGPVPSPKKWRFMNGTERAQHKLNLIEQYRTAKPIIIPKDRQFVVISARKNDAAVRAVTEAWLRSRYPAQLFHVELLGVSRSIENVIQFKASAIQRLGLTDFTEDNVAIVKGLRKLRLSCRIWLYADGQCRLDYRV